MILGIGNDLVEISRVSESMMRFGDRFLSRVFTAREIEYCQRKAHHAAESFAARFCAKEAAAKALGTGIAGGITWHDFEVVGADGQRPLLCLTGHAAERAEALGMQRAHLSLSHSRDLAMATVVLEGG